MNIGSYPQVYALGHREVEGIFLDPVVLEEKVDGSQFSFGLVDISPDSVAPVYELMCRSKNHMMIIDAPEKMFVQAVLSVLARENLLHPGWIYRAEYLQKPHHNVLAYNRAPEGYLIGFDIMTGVETYLSYEEKFREFERIGLETVPLLGVGMVYGIEQFKHLLDNVSILGGTQIEGVVVKNYNRYTRDKKVMIGKYVSERFKEVAGGEWRKANPTQMDILSVLINHYRTPARWQKAVQHLKENGTLTQSPKDIGPLIKEVQADTEKECADEIKDELYKHFIDKIRRGIISGFPEWYKELLLQQAFETGENNES